MRRLRIWCQGAEKEIMAQQGNKKTEVAQAGENLFNFAVARDDVKALVQNLPQETICTPAAVEYELQLLKIISTGWSISFFLENDPYGDQLAENFWKLIHGFSTTLSETTGIMTGHAVDYFQILNDRLDMYIAALTATPEMHEPAAAIGPEFARVCGDAGDVFTVMTGSRMFILTIARIKEYLESIELQ
jgi:hypothetical protein